MTEKLLVLITGANQGLGYHAARQLASTGQHHVLIGSRSSSKADEAVRSLLEDGTIYASDISPLQIDMNSDATITAAAQLVQEKYGRLDILMLNAGILNGEGSMREQYAQVYDTNVFGAAVTVDAFLPLLRRSTLTGGKRIAFTSSGLGSFHLAMETSDLSPKNFADVTIYRTSKTAVNMVMGCYARMLEDEGFVVSASDPGYCATSINGHSGVRSAGDGAKVLVRTVTGSKEEVHAKVIEENGIVEW